MSNSGPRKTRPAPFSIRLSENERALVLARAGGMPLGAYFKLAALRGDAPVIRRPKAVVADHAQLGQVLAALGASRVAQNLNQLAKATNLGILPVTPETEADLRSACAAILEMRSLLLGALGVERQEEQDHAALRDVFARHSAEASA